MMFQRRVEDSGKSTILSFGCRLFYAHIANVLIMLVVGMLVSNLSLLNIEAPDSLTSICVTIACFLFYLIYVYLYSWRYGQRDYNLVLYRHIDYSPLKPLYAALLSQMVGLILVTLVQFPSQQEVFVRYARYYYLYFNWFLITDGEHSTLIYYFPALVSPIVATAAYHMGYRGIYLADKLVYRKPKPSDSGKPKR